MPKNNFKVVMLGAQLAGKTSLIEQCIYGVYEDGMVNIFFNSLGSCKLFDQLTDLNNDTKQLLHLKELSPYK